MSALRLVVFFGFGMNGLMGFSSPFNVYTETDVRFGEIDNRI